MSQPLKLRLKTFSFPHGTYGELFNATTGERLCVTAECPWLNNEVGRSCVPAGDYVVSAHVSPRFGRCLIISAPSLGVTPAGPSLRTHCLFHAANRPSELKGCIAPGNYFGAIDNDWAVMESRKALEKLLVLVGNDEVQLRIERY
ncbi:DUF5675 family protein [Rheinheimera sp. 4Y26]|uniref:DUF5675 family protein n=1 Tax=Rheinheimera sp. 4Y26 TaxID=2977811 RepID=UPI0021B0DA63|nr:DUF5675 family protein [Rheinheimera sp. 4Y26]MCT6700903.1 DUF5675 family protein [Rheinheimera sp. 4Y26]